MPDYKDKDRQRLSRKAEFDLYEKGYDDPPEPEFGDYLIAWLSDCGLHLHTGAGIAPLTWSEIEAFNTAQQLGMTALEKRTVFELSRYYVSAIARHTDPKSPPPYVSPDDPLGVHQRKG